MSITNKTIVQYLISKKISDYDYQNCTDEETTGDLDVGVDMWDSALICAGGDFTEAARKYKINCSTLWSNFNTALYAASASDFASSAAIKAYFRTAYQADYTQTGSPDDYTFTETYNIIFNAIVSCWLYELYSRIEAEKVAEDKKKKCQKLLYDVVGKAAISPTMSDPLDETNQGAMNVSSGAAIYQGDLSTDFLDGFGDGFDNF